MKYGDFTLQLKLFLLYQLPSYVKRSRYMRSDPQ